MIDIEEQVFQAVSDAVLAVHPTTFVIGKETKTPAQFPCLSIVESDNYTIERTQDSTHNENHVGLMYTVTAYSNKAKGSKAECKSILAAADDAMLRMGFTRTRARPMSLDDATKYRLLARYEAVVSKDETIYRR